MHYVNLAAAIETLADATKKKRELVRLFERASERGDISGKDLYGNFAITQGHFAAGISYAIGMMLDPDTAAIIEAAAKERAQEDN